MPDLPPDPHLRGIPAGLIVEFPARRPAAAGADAGVDAGAAPGADAGAAPGGDPEFADVSDADLLESHLAAIAALDPIAYDCGRERFAEALGIRVSTLDKMVAARRRAAAGGGGSAGQGEAVEFPSPEPWPDPVPGAVLLAELRAAVLRFVVLPPASATATALWILHAWAHDQATISPILAITSPERRCGKTTLLAVLDHVVPRSLPIANVTVAALFRSVEKWSPTLLIDEGDTFLRDNDELRGILNSGHNRRSAAVLRTVGEDLEPRRFRTWAPKAIALIGSLPSTLADRSVPVRLQRRMQSESVDRLDRDAEADLARLARRCVRWLADHGAGLADADPAVPTALHDRARDNWRALIAIADLAGGDWPGLARAAAESLSVDVDDGETLGVMLLADIRAVFGADEAIASAHLVNRLIGLDGRPWGEANRGRPITQNWLARRLVTFGCGPVTLRIGAATPKGYRVAMFAEAWDRYLRAGGAA